MISLKVMQRVKSLLRGFCSWFPQTLYQPSGWRHLMSSSFLAGHPTPKAPKACAPTLRLHFTSDPSPPYSPLDLSLHHSLAIFGAKSSPMSPNNSCLLQTVGRDPLATV